MKQYPSIQTGVEDDEHVVVQVPRLQLRKIKTSASLLHNGLKLFWIDSFLFTGFYLIKINLPWALTPAFTRSAMKTNKARAQKLIIPVICQIIKLFTNIFHCWYEQYCLTILKYILNNLRETNLVFFSLSLQSCIEHKYVSNS